MSDDRPPQSPDELLTWLARSRPPFRDERLAPAVDRYLLWQAVRQELSADEERSVYLLVHSFKSWDDVYTEILVEHFHAIRRAKDRKPGRE